MSGVDVLRAVAETEERLVLTWEGPDGRVARTFPSEFPVWLGRDTGCHVCLGATRVSRRHASVLLREGKFIVVDQSTRGTWVEGRLLSQEREEFSCEVALEIGPYRVELSKGSEPVVGAEQRAEIHRALLERLDLRKNRALGPVTEARRREVESLLCELVEERGVPFAVRQRLCRELLDEAFGLGPLEVLLREPQVSEIMVVDAETIYVERSGRLELSGQRFSGPEAIQAAIERIVSPLGRRIDESNPMVDARLADGSRVNAIIAPLALRGPTLTIRKFRAESLTLDELVARRSLSREMADFLCASVVAKKNLVVSGGTGSGKTTLLNLLSAAIPDRERIVTIEDAAELRLRQPHVVPLEARPANLEGKGEISMRDLLKNSLRMRPDRIIVGECRGGEALDMLQAMNTGHEGSMTTTHANSPQEALLRLETLALMSGVELPLAAIRRQIATSLHLIVQVERVPEGTRRVTRIAEVIPQEGSETALARDLFLWERDAKNEDGIFVSTGYLPTFADRLMPPERGVRSA